MGSNLVRRRNNDDYKDSDIIICMECNVGYLKSDKMFYIDKSGALYNYCKNCRNKKSNKQYYKQKYGIVLDLNKMFLSYDIVQWYKWTLLEKTPNGKLLTNIPNELITMDNIAVITRYVVLEILNYKTREDICKLTQPLINQYKISFSKTQGIKNSPFNLVSIAFPELKIQEFEMVHATNNYWKSYDNFLKGVKHYYYNILHEQKINLEYYFSEKILKEIFGCLGRQYATKYRHLEWEKILKDIGIIYSFKKKNINCLGQPMNSLEEAIVFNYIYNILNIKTIQNIGLNKNCKFFNEKYKESYYPDFTIRSYEWCKIDKPIYIEYYGLFNASYPNREMIRLYNEKTYRKNEFFKSNKNIYFIDLYPEDLKNNYEGVKNKLTSFFIHNFNVDINKIKGGEQIG